MRKDISRKAVNMLVLSVVCCLCIAGCGYTTRGFIFKEKNIFISPIINNANVMNQESNAIDSAGYPVLLEKKLTNNVVAKFNADGNLRVSNDQGEGTLNLYCAIKDYRKESVRYNSTDSTIQEQELDLDVSVKLIDPLNKTLVDANVTGKTSYFLSGSQAKTESSAQDDLVDDAGKRILDAVSEQW